MITHSKYLPLDYYDIHLDPNASMLLSTVISLLAHGIIRWRLITGW
jgi:hypothetical protein